MSKKRDEIVERIFELAGEEMNISHFMELAKMSNKELESKYKEVVNCTYSYYEERDGEVSKEDMGRFTDKELEMMGVKK
jgi:hypothetical protein